MVINMNDTNLRTIAQLEQFLSVTPHIKFGVPESGTKAQRHSADEQRYAHIVRVLVRFDYPRLGKAGKGIVLAYLRCTTGYSRAQVNRLVKQWHTNRLADTPLRKHYDAPKIGFVRRYTAADIALLVECDRANESVCGSATAHLLKRAFTVYGDVRFERLATLSVSHLYNLRASSEYRQQRVHFTKTKPVCNPIGQRRAPVHGGKAGFVRIDSVHQGDLDGVKGVYHITCVDSVSQWQVMACVQGISEAFLLPALGQILNQFPFVINGFHSDNGSEYINYKVAKMLDKLLIEQTKSRARHSNDNALAESKNASTVRKHMGYSHIPSHFAEPINHFYVTLFNPWLNLHRPCMFATQQVDEKGKVRKRYEHGNTKTPLEALALLNVQGLVTFKTPTALHDLQAKALQQTDLHAAKQMQTAKLALFERFNKPVKLAA
jgi:transposase InsO family protein